jgi:hypothetical protein
LSAIQVGPAEMCRIDRSRLFENVAIFCIIIGKYLPVTAHRCIFIEHYIIAFFFFATELGDLSGDIIFGMVFCSENAINIFYIDLAEHAFLTAGCKGEQEQKNCSKGCDCFMIHNKSALKSCFCYQN